MNFITSRTRERVDASPLSPSDDILQISDGVPERKRKTKKRGRLSEEADSRSSPLNDNRQSSPARVSGSAVWAVTKTSPDTSPSPQLGSPADVEESSSATQPSPVRTRRPRAAWGDDVQDSLILTTSVSDVNVAATSTKKGNVHNGTTYVNSGFMAASDDSASEDCAMGDMLAELRRKIEAAEAKVADWKKLRSDAESDVTDARQEMSGRVSDLEALLRRCAELSAADISRRCTDYVENVDSCVRSAETHILSMRKIVKKYSRLPADNQHTQMLKKLRNKVQKQGNKVPAPGQWTRPMQDSLPSADAQMEMMRNCLGVPAAAAAAAETVETREDSASSTTSLRPVSTSIPAWFLNEPKLIATVSCRWKKDKRSCGITDVALTDAGEVLVVDSHNKMVKIYEPIENGGKLVRVLSRELVGRPSRISYIPATNSIIVTDDRARQLRHFSCPDWSDLGTVHPPSSPNGAVQDRLLHFPSGHCVADDGRIAVVDFDNKSVVVWDWTAAEAQTPMSFQTSLTCPGNVAITRERFLAVTDSKANMLKMFDMATGRETASFPATETSTKSEKRPSSGSSGHSSQDEERPLLEPHGVCADTNGLVFVADRRARRVRVFDEHCGTGYGDSGQPTDGELTQAAAAAHSLASYDDERHKIGVPYAVACNQRGMLAIAEYVGTVRIFSYIADTDSNA